MKQFTAIISVSLLTLAFSSCLEITQYAGMQKNGLILDTRISVQKALLEMAQQSGGGNNNSFLDDIDVDALHSTIPSKHLLNLEKIDTDLEMGLALRVLYDPLQKPDWTGAEVPVFFPYIEGKKLIVDLKSPDFPESTEANAVAAAIVSGFKYRLFIARSLLASPKTAYLLSDREKVPVSLISYPEFSLVEISMAYIMLAQDSFKLVIE